MNSVNNSLISVIIPAYNAGKYVSKCIESIMMQSYKNLEIILINDCSKDNTLDIFNSFANKDKRIKVIDFKENKGVSFARNYGVSIAAGEYISFIDADDYLEKDMFEKLYNAIVESDADISICGYDYVDGRGNLIINSPASPIKNELLSRDDLYYSLMKEKYWFYITPFNKLYKKDVIMNIKYKEGHRYEDEIYAHELFGVCNKAVCICDILYHYVQHDGSFISNGGHLYDHIDCFYDRYKYFKKRKYYDISKDSLYRAVEFYKTISKKEKNYIKHRFHHLNTFIFKTGLRGYEIKYKFTSLLYLLKFIIKDIKR